MSDPDGAHIARTSDPPRAVPLRRPPAADAATAVLLRELESSSWAFGAQLELLNHLLALSRSQAAGVDARRAVPAALARAVRALGAAHDALGPVLSQIEPQRARHAHRVGELMRAHGRALHENTRSDATDVDA